MDVQDFKLGILAIQLRCEASLHDVVAVDASF